MLDRFFFYLFRPLQSFYLTVVGTVFCAIGTGTALNGTAPFFVCISVGCVFLFANTAAVNLAIMASVPPESRPFTIGLSTLMIHMFGEHLFPPYIKSLCYVITVSGL